LQSYLVAYTIQQSNGCGSQNGHDAELFNKPRKEPSIGFAPACPGNTTFTGFFKRFCAVNYYPHHIGDYRSATLHLSDFEDLAYRRLLEMYYDTEKPIPADTQWVSRRLRLGLDVVETVLNDFFTLTENGFFHARCDMEIREYNIKAERSRLNGLKGGRRKANAGAVKNPAGSQQQPSSNPAATSGLANHEPVSMNQDIDKSKVSPPEGVSIQVWADFLKYRTALKAPVTNTAVNGFIREAKKAGITLEQALVTTIENNWRGFKSDWLKEKPIGNKFAGAI
jgi:uncharacterized protein YdaU (DUF1376 family)